MNKESLKKYLKEIHNQYGVQIFQNADRLCSVLTDLSGAERMNHEIRLLKTCYRYGGQYMIYLVRALDQKDNGICSSLLSLREELHENFMSDRDIRDVLECLTEAFETDFQSVWDDMTVSPMTIHMEELSDALDALDDKYQDRLWQKGDVLVSLLADQAPDLAVERRLVERVYGEASADIRKMIHTIVQKKDETALVIDLQRKLRDACMADCYIDGFLGAVLESFGLNYGNPLVKPAVAGDLSSLQGAGGNQTNVQSGAAGGGQANVQSGATGGGQTNSQPGTSNAQQQNNQTGQNSQTYSNQNTGAGSTTPKPDKKHGLRNFIIFLLVIAAVRMISPRIVHNFIAQKELAKEASMEADAADETETTMASTDETTAEETEAEEDALYIPKIESSIDLDQVEATTYDDSITDLRNYARYEGMGKRFIFAYPKNLYTDVKLESGTWDTDYVFTGTDGSELKYMCHAFSTKYTAEGWRTAVVNLQTEGMSDVKYLSFDDGVDEAYFYVTAKEGNLNVVINGYYNVNGGPADTMVLKYPEPTDEEDRQRKAYFVETLYVLNAFTDSKNQGFELRSFEDFIQ